MSMPKPLRFLGSAAALALCLTSATAVTQDAADTPSAEFTAPGPQGPLAGTFLGPQDGSQPVVLIIPGSGPTDRDGNNPLGVNANNLRLIAEGLADEGIASVRIDKRGMFASAAAIPDANAVTLADYAADTLNWIAAIKAQTGVPCVTVAGHSEGGLVALLAAGSAGPDICGLIMLAAPGRPLRGTLEAQLSASPAFASIMPQVRTALDRIAAGETVPLTEMPPLLGSILPPPVHPFLTDLFNTDPAQLAAAASATPMLLAYGEKDAQITLEDWQALRTAQPDAKSFIMPFATHVLKDAVGGDPAAAAATYTDPDIPLTAGLTEAMAQFVRLVAPAN